MNSTLLRVALLSTFALGCSGTAALTRAEAPTKVSAAAASSKASVKDAASAESGAAEKKSAAATPALRPIEPDDAGARQPGDFIVHKFSGSFREDPITLTQRVLAREGNILIIDMTLDEGGSKQSLRVQMDDSPERRGEVLSVARLTQGGEEPATVEAYEALMAKTAVAADQNEAVLGSEAVTVDVAGAPVACQKTSYRVRIGKRQATLRTVQSDRFAWGDIGGEITSESGDVVYRAELVESGRGEAPKPAGPQVARSDYEE
jgi:hypothetical protein